MNRARVSARVGRRIVAFEPGVFLLLLPSRTIDDRTGLPGFPPRNVGYNKWVLLEQGDDENVAHSERARQEKLLLCCA